MCSGREVGFFVENGACIHVSPFASGRSVLPKGFSSVPPSKTALLTTDEWPEGVYAVLSVTTSVKGGQKSAVLWRKFYTTTRRKR